MPSGSVVLSGAQSAPRGTLYAVNSFLEAVGVEFLAQDTTILPLSLPQVLPPFSTTFVPALEYRDQFDYTMRVCTNSHILTSQTSTEAPGCPFGCRATLTNL